MDRFEADDYIWLCEHCEAVLDDQPGFNYQSVWVCTECGHTNYIDENHVKEFDSESEEKAFWGIK